MKTGCSCAGESTTTHTVSSTQAIANTISTNVKQHLAQVDDVQGLVNETSFATKGYNRRVEDLFEASRK